MTRREFLAKLKEALENDLSGKIVQDNLDYYSNYIIEETRKGRQEKEVIAELGDPWVIARSIIDMAGIENGTEETSYETARSQGTDRQQSGENSRIHTFAFDSWWKKLLLILGILGVVLIVVTVIGGIFRILMPVILPVIVIVLVFRMIGRMRR